MVVLFEAIKALQYPGAIALRWLGAPLRPFFRFLFRQVFVRLYRPLLLARRALRGVLFTSKSWLAFLVANRFVAHGAVIAVSLAVSAASVWAGNAVNAESTNRMPLFAALSSGEEDENEVVEDEIPPVYRPAGISYLGGGVLRSEHIDVDTEVFVPTTYKTLAEGSAVLAPTSPGGRQIASRDRIVVYVVEQGDSIGSIAGDYGISVRTILWANNLGPSDFIHAGDKLKILPMDGVLHKVKSGDTLEKIAKRYSAETDRILAVNRLGSAAELSIGEELVVPDGEPPAAAAPKIARAPRPIAPIGSIFRPPAEAGKSTRYLWPTPGRVITQYFGVWERVRGVRIHTGVDIDGDYTSPIYAAEDGVVVRAGWNKGYGLMIDIDHGDGYLTRYAHSSKLLVRAGDYVKRGQTIAKVGTTGYSTGTHLHFEVRIGGRAVNPLPYLR